MGQGQNGYCPPSGTFAKVDGMNTIDWRIRYGALALIWGSNFMFITIAVQALAPLQVVWGRVALGALALAIVLWIRREKLPKGWRIWGHMSVAAIFFNTIPFTFFAYAAERIPSALSGVLNGTSPLFTLLFALAILSSERPTFWRTLGIFVGFGGVLVVFVPQLNDLSSAFTVGLLLPLGASLCYGIVFVYTRRFMADTGYSTVALSAGQVISATVQMSLIMPLFTTAPSDIPLNVVLAMVVLGAVGTGISYVLYYGLISGIGATIASTVTFLFPVVAAVMGVIFLGEDLSWFQVIGGAIIIAGAIIAQRTVRPAPVPAAAPPQSAVK